MKTLAKVSLSLICLSTAGCLAKDETMGPQAVQPCTSACTTIRGRLLTTGGQEGLTGATVTIIWSNYHHFLDIESHIKARVITDSKGNYEAPFSVSSDELAAGSFAANFSVDKTRYYSASEEYLSITKIRRDTTLQLPDYLIPRKAALNIIITNPAQAQNNYAFEIASPHGTQIKYSPTISRGPVFYNSSFPQLNPVSVPGDQPILFKTIKPQNGIVTITADSLFIPAGTTQTIFITY